MELGASIRKGATTLYEDQLQSGFDSLRFGDFLEEEFRENYLLLVVDSPNDDNPADQIVESDETNNVLALALPNLIGYYTVLANESQETPLP